MLNEKQVYNRLKKVYENEFNGNESCNELQDEWYGTDTNIWIWDRPSEGKSYKLELNLEDKSVTAYERTYKQVDNTHRIYVEWVKIHTY